MTTTEPATLYPRAYKAVPIAQGTYDEANTTWVSTCPATGCQYGVQLDDLQIAVDAVAGHIARVHPANRGSAHDPTADHTLPPIALLTRALDEFATGRPGEALGMVREARDRISGWVVE